MTDILDNDFPRGGFGNPLEGLQGVFSGSRASVSVRMPENATQERLQAMQKGFGPLIVGVHGLFSRGTVSTDLVLQDLADLAHPVLEFDWGPRPALWSRLFVGRFARQLREALEGYGPVHVLAHSFGPAIVREAMRQGQEFGEVFLFNPAISSRASFPEDKYRHITVIANVHDEVLTLGKRFLGAIGYGDMGRVGYQGKSARVNTVYGCDPDLPGLQDHVSAFTRKNLNRWANYIDRAVRTVPTTHGVNL